MEYDKVWFFKDVIVVVKSKMLGFVINIKNPLVTLSQGGVPPRMIIALLILQLVMLHEVKQLRTK